MTDNKCVLCPRSCNAERDEAKKGGFCQTANRLTVARASLHHWEEPCISGKNGSGTVFFSGCSLKCVYCQNYSISHTPLGKEISVCELVAIFDKLKALGAENINLVNPTHFAPLIKEALIKFGGKLPIVYNSSGYEKVSSLRKLDGLIDVYLPDLKYVTPEKSERYSGARDYFEYASKAILEMYRQAGSVQLDENAMIKKGLIIRCLILPGNANETIKALRWIKESLPDGVYVSLMSQYTPCGDIENFDELKRKITRREYEKVVNAMIDMGLENGFAQELSSADKRFIPDFSISEIEF